MKRRVRLGSWTPPPRTIIRRGPHPFAPDPDLPPDLHGRHVCAACHLVGAPDDAHHTMPDVPEQAEHLRRYEGDL